MRVFVTGGNGFIGSQVVRRLCAAGREGRSRQRPTRRTARIAGRKHEACRGDIAGEAALAAGLRGCEGVLHLAGISAWSDIRSPRLRAVGVEGAARRLAARGWSSSPPGPRSTGRTSR